MIKNSTVQKKLSESRRRWKGDSGIVREWTYEGGRKRVALVVADGKPIR